MAVGAICGLEDQGGVDIMRRDVHSHKHIWYGHMFLINGQLVNERRFSSMHTRPVI